MDISELKIGELRDIVGVPNYIPTLEHSFNKYADMYNRRIELYSEACYFSDKDKVMKEIDRIYIRIHDYLTGADDMCYEDDASADIKNVKLAVSDLYDKLCIIHNDALYESAGIKVAMDV